MIHTTHFHRYGALAIVLGLLMPSIASAQATPASTVLLLRPHCEAATPVGSAPVPTLADFLRNGVGGCANYGARDPQTQQTEQLNVGDTLDMDLVAFNPTKATLSNARAWLSYDPQTLQGVSVLLKDLPVPTPGESDFSTNEGLAKINGSPAPTQEVNSWLVVVARIQFKVLRGPRAGISPLGFYDLQAGKEGHTRLLGVVSGEEKNLLPVELGSLVVLIKPASATTPSSSSSVTSSAAFVSQSSKPVVAPPSPVGPPVEVPPPVSSSSTGKSPFVLLQIQNLRATTDGGSIYLAWDKLPSSEVSGYNVYYGTEKGRYIQRKSITADTSTHIIRSLPANTIYYVAVRGFNAANEETAFSKEVMLKTGDPRSSTSPLSLDPNAQPPAGNPLNGSLTGTAVPGKSGMPSFMVMILALCGVTGTFLAFRRQLRVKHALPPPPWAPHA